MAEGQRDISLSSPDTMIARATRDGIDFLLFMQAEEGLDAFLVAKPEITSIEQLRGKLLAGDPGDSNLDLIRKKILRTHGLEDSEYRVEIIGSSPYRLEAFLQGKVVAAMLTPPSSDKALASGGILLAKAEDHVPHWPLTGGWGLRTWIENHRDKVVRFIRAWVAATDWLLQPANREETLRLVMEVGHLSRERAAHAYSKVVPKARVNPVTIRKVLELRSELGVYPPPHEPTERFYDFSYWCEATGLLAPAPAGMPRGAV